MRFWGLGHQQKQVSIEGRNSHALLRGRTDGWEPKTGNRLFKEFRVVDTPYEKPTTSSRA